MEKSIASERVFLHVIAKGWVQGVGFRRQASRIAKELAIFGTVKNLEDGSVEIFLEGSRGQVNQFLKLLEQIYRPDDVTFISSEKPFKNLFNAFEIIY